MAGELQILSQWVAGVDQHIVAPLPPAAIERLLVEGPARQALVAGGGIVRVVAIGIARLVAGRTLAREGAVAAQGIGLPAGMEVERDLLDTGRRPLRLVAPLVAAHGEDAHLR